LVFPLLLKFANDTFAPSRNPAFLELLNFATVRKGARVLVIVGFLFAGMFPRVVCGRRSNCNLMVPNKVVLRAPDIECIMVGFA
jgi:hypothetical protein